MPFFIPSFPDLSLLSLSHPEILLYEGIFPIYFSTSYFIQNPAFVNHLKEKL